ncbi:MAG: gamma-glutamyl-gamma-aminobutyrate hydrolase family protein [Candidatus Brocadiales bacterium]|nr:gamma-glutamyl-gamma-aminobutyrate hydrolase family protein [Candidatus Bathyanammoxibius amoris]
MRPVIGINCNYEEEVVVVEDTRPRYYLDRDYCMAVELVGGIPVLLPRVEEDGIENVLGMLDGLILSGGTDIDPSRYGQKAHPSMVPMPVEKEEFDFKLIRSALKLDMPILGICYGEQLLNVSLGGSLFQDIPAHMNTSINHRNPPGGRHKVLIEKGSRLHRMLGVDAVDTNSAHHQTVDRLGNGLKVCARTEDGVIEAVESDRHTFVVAVQWHPETMLDEPVERGLFSSFIKEVRAYASQRI